MKPFMQSDRVRSIAAAAALLSLTMLLTGCTISVLEQPSTMMSEQAETLFQQSTLDVLSAGNYDGELTISALKQHGDFGVGTFDALDGELILADGQVYRVDDRGIVLMADAAMTTPFATVTFFEADQTVKLAESYTCPQLLVYLNQLLALPDAPYAIRVSGSFAELTIRSVPVQEEPYPSLAEALAEQVVFERKNVGGSMIGFRLPSFLSSINVTGYDYHFHFLSDGRKIGGHVLDCTASAPTIAVDDIDNVHIQLPQHAQLQPTAASAAASEATEPVSVFGAYGTSVTEPWNQVIHRALLDAEEAGQIRYQFVDEIGYSGEVSDVLRAAIAEFAPAIVVGDAFGNEAAVQAVAEEHPDIAFVIGSDERPSLPNLSVFDSWTYEAAYLAGMLAGGLTESNVVGIVAGFPEASVNRSMNAFIAGAKAVNPQVEVQSTFIESWLDPVAAGAAAEAQIAAGADVLFAERAGVMEVAAANGIPAIGNMTDGRDKAPAHLLTSVLWEMTPTVAYVIEQVRGGSYRAQDLADFSRLAIGGVRLAPIGTDGAHEIPAELLARIEAQREEISRGRFEVPIDDDRPPAVVR